LPKIKKIQIFFPDFFKIIYKKNYLTEAAKYSRFIRAMFSKEIPFGHSTSHAPVLVQFPRPSSSIWLTMFNTRSVASTLPCGNRANCEPFAATYSRAEAFLQEATQAPHPIQAAASKDFSALSLRIGIALPSRVFPEVCTEINPPPRWILSDDRLSTPKSLIA